MLSVVILAKNEEERIRACLESVKWADEILILDTGSTDKTIEIARKYTDKIFSFKDLNYADLRNTGIEKSSYDWVFYIDPDERVSAQLKEEVLELIQTNGFSAVAISRKNYIFGQEAKYGSFWPDWVVRLLKKSDFETWVGKIHEYPKFKGKLGYSKNSLFHLTHRDVDQVVLKSLEWSKIDARLRLDSNHPKMSGWRFIRIFFTEIFNQLFVRKGITGGTIGIIDSFLQTFSLFITYVRLWQLQQSKPLEEIYKELDKKLIESGFNQK